MLTLLITSHYCVNQRDEDVQNMKCPLRFYRRKNLNSDLSEHETQDNVSMNNFKNTLTALARQVRRGGNTSWQ